MSLKSHVCSMCGSGSYVYHDARFPTIHLCFECLKRAQLVLFQLMGEDFTNRVLMASGSNHFMRWLCIDGQYRLELNLHRWMTP